VGSDLVIIHAQNRHAKPRGLLHVIVDCKFMLLQKGKGKIHPRIGYESAEEE